MIMAIDSNILGDNMTMPGVQIFRRYNYKGGNRRKEYTYS